MVKMFFVRWLLPKKFKQENDLQRERLEIYKIMVEMADRVSQRRQAANSFYLSINTAIVGGSAFLQTKISEKQAVFAVSLTDILVCILWSRAIESYRNLNRAKFEVIHTAELMLALQPYSEEWRIINPAGSKKKHFAFYETERLVPRIFLFVYLFEIAIQIRWGYAFSIIGHLKQILFLDHI